MSLFAQFNGHNDYTAIGNTMNVSENPCALLTSSSATLNLSADQTVLAALLYWSGPWPTTGGGDFNVNLNGTPITASRTFNLTSGSGTEFFSGYADVTSIVQSEGNGIYTFSGLDIDLAATGTCANQTDYAGWSIMVIYEDPSLLLNQVNVFDGFVFVSANNPSLSITLENISAVSDTASKIGFLAWEGDAQIANGESLFINGVLIDNPPLNPGNNAFNGTNSYTNSNTLYNMDMDFYDLSGIVVPGDTSLPIELTSLQDLIIVNNIITVVNSELPDGTVQIDNVIAFPQQDEVQVTYTVSNVNSTNVLPAGTALSFFANGIFAGSDTTNQNIPIGGTLTQSVMVEIPSGVSTNFILSAVVDPSGTIPETNESNNENEIPVTITPITLNLNPSPLEVCDDNADGFAEFTLTDADNDITLGNSSLIVSYHPTVQNAEFDINPLPSNYTNTTPFNDEVFARVMNASETSAAVVSLDLIVNEKPPIVAPEELFIDEGDNDAMAIFDLTVKIPEILDGLDPTFHDVSFYETAANAQSNTNPISNPEAYANLTNPQTIFVRVDNNQTTCFDTVSFQIVTDGPLGLDDQFLNDFVQLILIVATET